MTPTKKVLFWSQILVALGFGAPQIMHAMGPVDGTSLSNFVLNSIYFLFLVLLGWNSHKRKPTPTSLPSVIVCLVWLAIMAGVAIATGFNPEYEFSRNDIRTTEAAILLIWMAAIVVCYKGTPLGHPAVKGFLALAAKSLPQAMMAIKVLQEGGSGISGLFILAGLLSIGLRLVQLNVQWRETKTGEGNLFWMIVADAGNIITWIGVSVAWAIAS